MNKLTEEISVAIAYAKCCDNTDANRAIIDQASESIKKMLRAFRDENTEVFEDPSSGYIEVEYIRVSDLDNFIEEEL